MENKKVSLLTMLILKFSYLLQVFLKVNYVIDLFKVVLLLPPVKHNFLELESIWKSQTEHMDCITNLMLIKKLDKTFYWLEMLISLKPPTNKFKLKI